MNNRCFLVIACVLISAACGKTKTQTQPQPEAQLLQASVTDLECENLKGKVYAVFTYHKSFEVNSFSQEKFDEFIHKQKETSIVSAADYSDTLRFDRGGMMIPRYDMRIERDTLQRIAKIITPLDYLPDAVEEIEYQYDGNKRIAEKCTKWEDYYNDRITFNGAGDEEKSETEYRAESFTGKTEQQFHYILFDENGNWTKRVAVAYETWINTEELQGIMLNDTLMWAEEREIIYWE